MENISVAVVTDNENYGKALSAGLLNVDRSFIISLINKDEFMVKMKKCSSDGRGVYFTQSFDLILWDGEEAYSFYEGNIVFLTETPSVAVKDSGQMKFCIYKYCCAQQMVSEIFDIYGILTGRSPKTSHLENIQIYVFASWSGGSGCSTVAVETARELNRFYGRKVLYLSFEEIESTENFMRGYSGTFSLSKYLYHLLKKNGKAPFIESYIVKDEYGVEAFSPEKGRNPLKKLNGRELCTFLDAVISDGRYDTLVIDIGGSLSENDIMCLDMAEKICIVTLPENNKYREEKYVRYLLCKCGEHVMNKIVKVVNMAQRDIYGDIEDDLKSKKDGGDDFIEPSVYIEKSRHFIEENGIKKVLDEGGVGSSIGLIAELMTEPETAGNAYA